MPAASVAVHVTLVVPTGNVEPDGGTQLTVGAGLTVSVALTRLEKSTTAPAGPTAASMTGDVGTLRIGGTVSTTRTVRIAVVVLPAASTAVYVTR